MPLQLQLGAELTIPELNTNGYFNEGRGQNSCSRAEKLRDLAKHNCTIALFLSATLTKKIVKEFLDAGWSKDTPVGVVYKATWPDQKIVRSTLEHLDEDMRTNGIRKQAMILAGWALDKDIHQKDFVQSFTIKRLLTVFVKE